MRFVVTAGPTQEPIDPVRYLSNRSSGRMGYAIAEAALEAGHQVILISGRVNLSPPPKADFISVLTSDEMHDAVHEQLPGCDVLIMCAAVADYKPSKFSADKIKKHEPKLSLELTLTRDILASLPKSRNFLVVGFAAETSDLKKNAQKKLQEKHLDMIVANDVSRADVGMESADNEVTILFPNGEMKN
ncbi:MAG: coabc dfp: phosphopantothenoylcysteine decarboxylase / phosphopantothenate--cysteine ligase, partial [Spartobacteria bacterium]|nr:coabc dfp: phosphopantothenoylcysteine decarboxylase / phosphopantothenate--cysteine ligase [Spartobacteria bacterium]